MFSHRVTAHHSSRHAAKCVGYFLVIICANFTCHVCGICTECVFHRAYTQEVGKECEGDVCVMQGLRLVDEA